MSEQKRCTCAARSDAECVCGAWDTSGALHLARSRIRELEEALTRIAAIEDRMFGPDWEEIEEARNIARAALNNKEQS